MLYPPNLLQEYFKKRVSQVEFLPAALQAVQKQMILEKELRTSLEQNVEVLSKKLKTTVMQLLLII